MIARLENAIKNNCFLIGLVLTVALLWPLVSAPFFSHHDDVQVIRLYEMDKCFKDSQIPCRWVPDLGGLYGYPLFNYYAPLPYYFGEIIYLITGSFIISAKIMFAVSFIGAYIFMYLLGKKLWGNLGGALSGIFYSFAPYHSVAFYVRGAMGEMWGLMLFPAVLWSLLKLKEKSTIANALILSLSLAFLNLSHNLSFFIFLPILLILGIYFYFLDKNKSYLKLVLFSLVLGLIISSFYLIPMVAEKSFAHSETMTYGYFSYTEHFKGLKKLFLERMWGWGASVREIPGAEKDGMSFQIGWIHLLAFTFAVLLLFKRKLINTNNRLIIFFSLIILASVIMIHPRSLPIWQAIPPLAYLQFPWRLLMLIIFSISVISGSILVNLEKRRVLVWLLLVVLVVAFNFSYFHPEKFYYYTDQAYLSGENWDKLIKRSIFDFLPTSASEPPAELATSRYQVLTGEVEIRDFQEGTNWISFKADAKGHSIIRLSQYYFPDWVIKVDGNPIRIDYDNNLGLMTFILGEGQHLVEARLNDTVVRRLSNLTSLIGIIIFLLLLLLQSHRIKRWFVYYIETMRR